MAGRIIQFFFSVWIFQMENSTKILLDIVMLSIFREHYDIL